MGRVSRGDLVLDPFSGSGSSRVAAESLGLDLVWRGCDIDKDYCEVELLIDKAAGAMLGMDWRSPAWYSGARQGRGAPSSCKPLLVTRDAAVMTAEAGSLMAVISVA
jgi:hypothetical protein